MLWYGAADELVPLPEPLTYGQRLRDHGYRHELDVFTADHFTWPQLDEWDRAREFFEDHDTVGPTPARVTFRRIPAFDDADLGLVRDGAYWLSDVRVEDGAESGLVDAESSAVDTPEPVAIDYESAGTEPLPHVARGTRWETLLDSVSTSNRLSTTLESVTGVTVWVEEAQLDPQRPLELTVETTTPTTIELAGSFGTREVTVPGGRTTRTLLLVRDGQAEGR